MKLKDRFFFAEFTSSWNPNKNMKKIWNSELWFLTVIAFSHSKLGFRMWMAAVKLFVERI